MKNCTAVIINFLREPFMFHCVNSLKQHYPDIQIKVAENGFVTEEKKQKLAEMGVDYIPVEWDAGVCKGRNALVSQVKTKYVLVGDDDFEYTKDTKVDQMVQFLEEHPEFDLVGGRIFEKGKLKDYQGDMEIVDKAFKYTPLKLGDYEKGNIRYKKCDLTFNFFVARTKLCQKVKWDENIKVRYEHSDWFYSVKQAGGSVAFTPDCVVNHKPAIQFNAPRKYGVCRGRASDKEYFYKKHKIEKVIDMFGREVYLNTNPRPVPQQSGSVVQQAVTPQVQVQPDGNFTFIIKTFMRKNCLERLLTSIVKYYPNNKILIADDGNDFSVEYYTTLWKKLMNAGLKVKPTAFNMPFDSGLSAGRNKMVEHTQTEFVVLLDDDFVFTADTKIEKLLRVAEQDPNLGVVGGCLVNEVGRSINFEGELRKEDRDIRYYKKGGKYEIIDDIQYKYTETVLNFGIFRKQMLVENPWDNELKIAGEHTDFFLRLKDTRWKVAYCPEVVAQHIQHIKPEYKSYRSRQEFLKKLLNKHNADRLVYHNGQAIEYDREQDVIIHTRV